MIFFGKKLFLHPRRKAFMVMMGFLIVLAAAFGDSAIRVRAGIDRDEQRQSK
jgi:hypothetical protein